MTTNHKYTPTIMQVERSYIMRQATLDQEAGRGPQPLVYAAEFRRMIYAVESAAEQRGADRVLKYFQDHVIEVGEYTYIGATIQELIDQASENRADREGDGGRN